MESGNKDGPDRGWSWVVAFAACFTSLVLAGIFRTSGVLFVAFISEFGVTREEASWPVVLCISVLNLTGPFSGVLGQRYGVRPVTVIGAFVATVGVSACYFTTSLKIITIYFGIIFGIGYGLVSTLMPVIVNVYFLEYRATANGIANSGSCFGSMILPIFFEYLISSYGLSGCFLLTGGVVLHIAIAGVLLRPPSWLKQPKQLRQKESSPRTSPVSASSHDKANKANTDNEHYYALVESIRHRQVSLDNSVNSQHEKGNVNTENTASALENTKHQNFYFDRNSEPHRNLHSELLNTLKYRCNIQESNDKELNGGQGTQISEIEHDKEIADELQKSLEEFEKSLRDFQTVVDDHPSINASCSYNEVHLLSDKPHSTADACAMRDRSFKNFDLRGKVSSPRLENYPPNETEDVLQCEKHLVSVRSSSDSNYCMNSVKTIPTSKNSEFKGKNSDFDKQEIAMKDSMASKRKAIFNIFDSFYTVLKSPMFYVTSITNVSFYFLFHMYVVIIVDYAQDRGVPESDTKYIIFAFSLSDLVGRLCLGWVTDKKFLRRSHFVMCCMAAIGVIFFCFSFANGYGSLLAVSSFYGLLLGCTMVVFPILLVDFLGTELHPVAYGCMCFMNGFASFTRPFLIGYFRDNVGSYSNIFYILGAISFLASTLWLLEYCFIKKKKVPIIEQSV